MNYNLDFSTWDTTDWVIAGTVGFAVLIAFNAMKLSVSRLRTKRRVWR